MVAEHEREDAYDQKRQDDIDKSIDRFIDRKDSEDYM